MSMPNFLGAFLTIVLVENDIPEMTHAPGTLILDNIEPVWMDA